MGHILQFIRRRWRTPLGAMALCIVFSAVYLGVLFVVYGVGGDGLGGVSGILRYLAAVASYFWKLAAVMLAAYTLVHLMIWWVVIIVKQRDMDVAGMWHKIRTEHLPRMIRIVADFAKYVSIAIVAHLLSMSILSEISRAYKDHLWDEALLRSDYFIFGKPLFVLLQEWTLFSVFSTLVIFSYGGLVTFLIVGIFYLSVVSEKNFRRLLAAFCFSLILGTPFWHLMPAIGPNFRYIDNIYHQPIPADIQTDLSAAKIVQPIREYQKQLVAGRKEEDVQIVSSIPSAHVMWAIILAYYLYISGRRLRYLVIPILTLSAFGTGYLGMHYFIDIPLGILFGVGSIWLAKFFDPVSQEATVQLGVYASKTRIGRI